MDKKRLLQDLIDGLAAADGGMKKKEAEDFIRFYFDAIQRHLLNDRLVKVNGLGTFKLIEVEARNSVNVNTGEAVVIREHLKLSFLPDSAFKEAVNKPFADFEPVETTPDNTKANDTSTVETTSIETAPKEPVQNEAASCKTEPSQSKAVEETSSQVQPPHVAPVTTNEPDIQYISEEQTTNAPTMKPENPRRPIRTILLVVSGILFLAGLTYWSIVSNQSAKKDITEKLELVDAYNLEDTVGVKEEPAVVETPAKTDSTKPVTTPPVVQTSKALPKEVQKVALKEKQQPTTTSTPKTTTKPATKRSIPATLVIGTGDRLTLIAQKYYGHKVFWVYIYMENKEAISNPNNVPIGTTLRLPEKHPTMMDPNNPQAIKKAEELQDRIISQLQSSRSK